MKRSDKLEVVSKRVHVTLPDTIHADLDAWAKTRGQAIASLGAIAIEFAVRRAKEAGEFVSPCEPTNRPLSMNTGGKADSQCQSAIASCMKKMVTGEKWNPEEIVTAAQALDLDPDHLHEKLKRSRED